MKAKVGAKVNLSLAVTGKRGGLHTLDMRVCSVSLYDTAEIIGGDGARFEWASVPQGFVKEMFEPRLNEIYSALKAKFGGDFRFRFRKGIPSGAGLGGSSALAAAMAKLWTRGTGKSADDGFLLSLGSDVPYMYRGGEARVTGCGESVERRPFVARKVLVAFPEGGVDTAKAYALYDDMAAQGTLPEREGEFFNDLCAPAVRLNPDVARVKNMLSECGAERVVMSGSGSAVCAFFGIEEESFARGVYLRASAEARCVLADTIP